MPEPAMISGTCPECRQDLEHCHGTAIERCDGSADCSDDPDCQVPGEVHLFLITCAEVGCGCGPAGIVVAGLSPAEAGLGEVLRAS